MIENLSDTNSRQRNLVALAQFQQVIATLSPRAIVTLAIVMANIVVFVTMVARGVDFFSPDAGSVLNWGANFGPVTMNGQWWRLVTCMFLHFGILHLAMNMWVLWSLARMVERLVGSMGFGIAYLVSGIAGSIASLAWHPTGISAGASGAVFGVAGALLGFVVLRRDTIPDEVRNQLLKNMVFFLVLNTIVGMSASHIDSAAHIGGFAGGLICGLILSQPLSPQMIAQRKFRNAAAAIAGAVLLPLAIFALPDALPNVPAELGKLAEVEQQVYDTYNTLTKLAVSGAVTETEFADRLERDVLPPWIDARKRMEALAQLEYSNPEYLSHLVGYMKCREESWQLRAEGIRLQDVSILDRADEKSRSADEMAAGH